MKILNLLLDELGSFRSDYFRKESDEEYRQQVQDLIFAIVECEEVQNPEIWSRTEHGSGWEVFMAVLSRIYVMELTWMVLENSVSVRIVSTGGEACFPASIDVSVPAPEGLVEENSMDAFFQSNGMEKLFPKDQKKVVLEESPERKQSVQVLLRNLLVAEILKTEDE